jgi:formyl-CoA transferase
VKPHPATDKARPLDGCRVLDFGIITAGAATGAILADLGAEVIKIESPGYRDPFREWAGERPAHVSWTTSPLFRATNRNKLNISLDLKRASGRAAFMRLVAKSDVVVENFRRGVLEQLGIGYPALREVNADIVLASISSQGDSGPQSGQISYGSTLEAIGGLAWRTGYASGPPVISGVDLNYPDQVVAIFASGMVLAALAASRGGAGGVRLDISQRELTSFLSGEMFVGGGEDDTSPRTGNAQDPFPLQDCFKAADDRWIAVTVTTENLDALAALLGLQRTEPMDGQLRQRMAAWIAERDYTTCVQHLCALGIAAAVAGGGVEVFRRQPWTDALIEAADGAILKGFPFQLPDRPMRVESDTRPLGADTIDVLQRIAGYTRAEIDSLAAERAIEIQGFRNLAEEAVG